MKMSINSGCFPSMISLSFNYDPKLIFSQISSKCYAQILYGFQINREYALKASIFFFYKKLNVSYSRVSYLPLDPSLSKAQKVESEVFSKMRDLRIMITLLKVT